MRCLRSPSRSICVGTRHFQPNFTPGFDTPAKLTRTCPRCVAFHQETPVVQRLRAVLTDGVAEGATSTVLQQALSDPAAPAILIIHERMVNLPPQLVPPLHRCLQDDIRKMLNSKVSRSIADTRQMPGSHVQNETSRTLIPPRPVHFLARRTAAKRSAPTPRIRNRRRTPDCGWFLLLNAPRSPRPPRCLRTKARLASGENEQSTASSASLRMRCSLRYVRARAGVDVCRTGEQENDGRRPRSFNVD